MTDVWKTHRQFLVEREDPDDCPGNLVIIERDDALITVRCDSCTYMGCVPVAQLRDERETASW